MKSILCYGDSNTWGFIPGKFTRYPYEQRWTTVLQKAMGAGYVVIPEGLNKRTTAFDDPFFNYRNGRFAFDMILDTHSPLDLVVIMLGVNDLKEVYHARPETIAWGINSLINEIKGRGFGPGTCDPKILVLSPPLLEEGDGKRAGFDLREFTGGHEKSRQLAKEYEKVAKNAACYFLDLAPVVKPSEIDGLHLDEAAHKKLGEWLASEIVKLEF